jgi:DDE family transposase
MRIETEQKLRNERAKLRRQVRRWQKACEEDDSEPGGLQLAVAEAERKLAEMPRRLEKLRKSGMKKLSRTDEDARFLRTRGGRKELGYTAEIAVSDDHLIVAQRVTQNAADNASLLPMVDAVEQQCGEPPEKVVADSGFFSLANIEELERRAVDGYVPDSNLARELNTGQRCPAHNRPRHAAQRRMRKKLRSSAGRAVYRRRKATVEPVFGVLKQQRGMRQFRTTGLKNVETEFTWAAVAYNLTRLYARN